MSQDHNEYRRLCLMCNHAPIENAPLLLFTVVYFLLFSSSFLFFSFLFLFLLVIYVHCRVICSVNAVHFFFSGLYSHENEHKSSI